jgi:hypothetical protein
MTTTTNPNRKASEIGFGIEIECNIPTAHHAEFPVGGYHRGTPVNVDGLRNWNTQADGSVVASGDYYPAEIVSPILKGEDGLRQVVAMLDYLAEIGAKVNPSCGLHVHVDCAGVDVTRITKLFKAYEVAFYDMNGENARARENSNYCLPSTRWNGTRYQSLNLTHTCEVHPHIEIRVWQGAMKPETVVSAIYMAVSLVSRASAPEKVTTSDLRTNEPKQVMAKFISRFMHNVETCMIVPDERPDDIWQEMMKQAMTTNRSIR